MVCFYIRSRARKSPQARERSGRASTGCWEEGLWTCSISIVHRCQRVCMVLRQGAGRTGGREGTRVHRDTLMPSPWGRAQLSVQAPRLWVLASGPGLLGKAGGGPGVGVEGAQCPPSYGKPRVIHSTSNLSHSASY